MAGRFPMHTGSGEASAELNLWVGQWNLRHGFSPNRREAADEMWS
jgi:hypothetical protein